MIGLERHRGKYWIYAFDVWIDEWNLFGVYVSWVSRDIRFWNKTIFQSNDQSLPPADTTEKR